jgi:hypothetical protein
VTLISATCFSALPADEANVFQADHGSGCEKILAAAAAIVHARKAVAKTWAAHANCRRLRLVRTTRIAVLALALAGAATAAAALLGASGSAISSADAAVLRAVRSAVTPRPGTILHEQTLNTLGDLQWRYEFWQRSDAPENARVIKGGSESSFDGTTMESYDPSTNTIREPPANQQDTPEDPVTKIRTLLDNGDAQIVGRTTIDGRPVFKIQAHSTDDVLFTGTIYVDRQSYEPVLAEIEQRAYDCGHSTPCAGLERIRFLTYEYLPANTQNLQLLSTATQHPSARVIQGLRKRHLDQHHQHNAFLEERFEVVPETTVCRPSFNPKAYRPDPRALKNPTGDSGGGRANHWSSQAV